MDVHLQRRLREQHDLVTRQQLLDDGWTRQRIERRLRRGDWHQIYPGVYRATQTPTTPRQLWMGATLTAPNSVLSVASAGAAYGFRPVRGLGFVVVTRPGSGGPQRLGDILVTYSRTLAGNTTYLDGIPITTPERAIIDLSAHSHPDGTGRMIREAVRLRHTTLPRLSAAIATHRGARGIVAVREKVSAYAQLDLRGAFSDAENYAQGVIAAAGRVLPRVNVPIAGHAADLSWAEQRLIIEIDGPQFHLFGSEDERIQRKWEAAGWRVIRISSDDVYDRPWVLLALVPR